MERRINKKFEDYISEFKDEMRAKTIELGLTNNEQVNQLLQYMYDYDRLTLNKEDFAKRKRVKNVVSFFDRCCAYRANNEQCTRKKREGNDHCGTHIKGTPHGVIDFKNENQITTKKVEVWAQDIQGIIYYIDKFGNVYQAEDVVINKTDPMIIAKYVRNGDVFSIPEFGI